LSSGKFESHDESSEKKVLAEPLLKAHDACENWVQELLERKRMARPRGHGQSPRGRLLQTTAGSRFITNVKLQRRSSSKKKKKMMQAQGGIREFPRIG
jgi:hypothetical protein